MTYIIIPYFLNTRKLQELKRVFRFRNGIIDNGTYNINQGKNAVNNEKNACSPTEAHAFILF